MKEYKIMLTFQDGRTIEGVGKLTKEEAEKRIADFLKTYPEFEDENLVKFSVEKS